MAKKRLFEILDGMNIDDGNNNTELVAVSGNLIRADKVRGGASISMGVPEKFLYELMSGSRKVILLLVDSAEYKKRDQ